MFKFKRNFSIRDSPAKLKSISPSASRNSSPNVKRICLSVTPRKTIWEEKPKATELAKLPEIPVSTPIPNQTPGSTPTPIKIPVSYPSCISPAQQLLKKKIELKSSLECLEDKIHKKFKEIVTLKEKIVEMDMERIEFDDLLASATTSQVVLRNLLNEMYNTGNEIAAGARSLFEESKNNHQKKFDKLAFAVSHRMDSCDAEITRLIKQTQHELELNKRIQMTLECQNQSQATRELSTGGGECSIDGLLMIEANKEESIRDANQKDEVDETDEDCIIIEEKIDQVVTNGISSEASNQTVEQQEETYITEPSTEGNVIAEEDEETDVEEEKQAEEGSFTPCQAQKPN